MCLMKEVRRSCSITYFSLATVCVLPRSSKALGKPMFKTLASLLDIKADNIAVTKGVNWSCLPPLKGVEN